MAQTMRAAVIEEYSKDTEIRVKQIPVPEVGEADVKIKVKAAGVNPVDWKIRSGYMKGRIQEKFPLTLGWDVAGEVVEIGHAASRFPVGSRVYAYARRPVLHYGTYAEYVVLPESYFSQIPENLNYEQAGSVPLASLTAYQALFDRGKIKKNDHVLIVGGSGGVGSFAVQLAKIAGAEVSALAGSSNHEFMRSLGADYVFDYKDDFVKEINETLPRGIDLVFDCFGFDSLKNSVDVLKDGGRMVSIAGKEIDRKGKDIDFHYHFVEPNAKQLDQIGKWLKEEKLKTNLSAVYKLEEANEAHEQIQTFHTQGKIVINPEK